MLHSLQEQSSFYYLVVLQLRLLGHVGVNTITNVEDNSILLKLSLGRMLLECPVWVGCCWNAQFT